MTKSGSSAASPTTTAFYAQAALSFGLALAAVTAGIVYLPVNGWVRGFLALGMLYLVTSAFTLAKCVRDRQDETSVVSRVDQARLDKLLAEHDPYKTTV
ncbi:MULTISPECIES: YiaA/YiaB family inner membrane protein [unclassified Amycolatopsis]|uniref:YiaA/YiaB family inner membrane protein n=1 Tax=unclassified Amycolatopsis TaxID=2618356 RepID=UPI002E21DED8|nr:MULTISPECIES: YiaA/YiaB family inner membrane protein [unclassified Amycolatopsis]